jgi:hypothetical protein
VGGSAFDPETGLLYVNSNDVAWTAKLRENQELPSAQPSPIKPDIDLRDFTNGSTPTAPAVAPPWGTLSAIDLNIGITCG